MVVLVAAAGIYKAAEADSELMKGRDVVTLVARLDSGSLAQ